MADQKSSRPAKRYKSTESTSEVPNGLSAKSLRSKGYTKAPKYRENQFTFDSFANMRMMRPTKTKEGQNHASGGGSDAGAQGLREQACLPAFRGPSRQRPTTSGGTKNPSWYASSVCAKAPLPSIPLGPTKIRTATEPLFDRNKPLPDNTGVELEPSPIHRKPSGQQSLISDIQEMYACLISFEGSLSKWQSAVPKRPIEIDPQIPLFDKALFYSTSTVAYTSRNTHPHPGLRQISRKFFMMRQERCRVGYNRFLEERDPTAVKEISHLIDKARSALDLLCHITPDLTTAFRMIQGALDLYLKKIHDLHTERSNTPMAPWFLPGSRPPPTPPSLSRSNSQYDDDHKSACIQQPTSVARTSTDCRDFAVPRPLLVIQGETPEARAATLTLSGWIYLGQTITQDFGVYFRVFIMLIRAIQS